MTFTRVLLLPDVVQSGETMLIGAVRGGHVEIVRALLNKYADIDIRGQVGASFLAVSCCPLDLHISKFFVFFLCLIVY